MKYALVFLVALQEPPVDEVRVDEAIKKGVAWLKTAKSPGAGFAKIEDADDLILLTFVHAGVAESDPRFQELLAKMIASPPARTYEAALRAMVLEELDRVKYQGHILRCAQFLVDNQCKNGQWSYGNPTEHAKEPPPVPKEVASSGGVKVYAPSGPRTKPKVVRKLAVKQMKDGPAAGDNSNSQYAALGLRACLDAGIAFPTEVIQRARQWWIESQHPVATGTARGWCYNRKDVCAKKHAPYAAMTAGATGALVIYDHMLAIDWKKDVAVQAGVNWLAARFSVTENAGTAELGEAPKTELYYYLYALERLGMLYGTEKIGQHSWYGEGAPAILAAQRANGSWSSGIARCDPTWDTCFSILFLRRATRALVATEAAGSKK